ncbi:hypothetical protein Ddye_026673 [Dipteronia dyeriana]|uniref:Uncharacterized protein n=1 Tax=Dipteronia dyeriana TaxID=168575 RepID=A0AAD9TN49_9ROSI|nr:hypothetical protein Ddye_026673 [Dipteronia dyeriana]
MLRWDWCGGSTVSNFIKAIGSLLVQGSTMAKILEDGIRVVAGRGARASLWIDMLVEGIPLKRAFPRIYSLVVNKLGHIREYKNSNGLINRWEITLKRPLLIWENQQWESYRVCFDSIVLRDAFCDNIGWSHESSRVFTVKSFTKCLEGSRTGEVVDFSEVWQGLCPPKVKIFVWQLIHGRVLVRDVLKKIGLPSNMSSLCPIGQVFEESVDHLFPHSTWSWGLWQACMNGWGVLSCSSCSLLDWWRGWNNKVFKDAILSLSQTEDLIHFKVVWWYKYLGGGSSEPITHMLLNVVEYCKNSRKMKLYPTIEWIPPSVDSFMFTFDGSARGNPGQTGVGGVIKNQYGNVLCTFSVSTRIHDAIMTEIGAIAMACELCSSRSDLVRMRIVIASNSKVAVSWINYDGSGSMMHEQTILDIRNFLRRSKSISVVHIFRDINSFVDSLARKGSLNGGKLVNWYDC